MIGKEDHVSALMADALRVMVYETTHLSPEESDGSHNCKISRDALAQARGALLAHKSSKANLMLRAYEVVHHETDCPAIGGNGDVDCKCDAVPFLRDLEQVLSAK